MQVEQFASQKMEIKIPKLAIIAGNGNIPFYLLEECERKGRDYCLIIIEGHGKELAKPKLGCGFLQTVCSVGNLGVYPVAKAIN